MATQSKVPAHGRLNLIDEAQHIERDDRMNTLISSEKDGQQKETAITRKAGRAKSPRLKQPNHDLTCNEADVDDLLSTGELT
jgi:hypothetical protein